MSLPPDGLLVRGVDGGQEVVEVHHDVHERVDGAEECRVTSCEQTTHDTSSAYFYVDQNSVVKYNQKKATFVNKT